MSDIDSLLLILIRNLINYNLAFGGDIAKKGAGIINN